MIREDMYGTGLCGYMRTVVTTLWEDEQTLCYGVSHNGVTVLRRADNGLVNGTKLLNVTGMTRGRRDGILKHEHERHVVKVGSMSLKGVWIPLRRAQEIARREGVEPLLYPLFVRDLGALVREHGIVQYPPAASVIATTTTATTATTPVPVAPGPPVLYHHHHHQDNHHVHAHGHRLCACPPPHQRLTPAPAPPPALPPAVPQPHPPLAKNALCSCTPRSGIARYGYTHPPSVQMQTQVHTPSPSHDLRPDPTPARIPYDPIRD